MGKSKASKSYKRLEMAVATQNQPETTAPPIKRTHHRRNWLIIFFLLLILLVLIPFVIVQLINATNQDRMYDTVQQVPARPVAMVFGAGVNWDGSPSWMLADRLDGGITLYKTGKVQQLLMTGDNVSSTEVTSMHNYAVRHGVPTSAILDDTAGLRTYDSCYRAVHNFGISRAVLVTQAYHLPRALYLCNAMGIDAVGLKVGLNVDYGNQATYSAREFLATFGSWIDITFTHPAPGKT
jgi:vancomycin permeability regulator SanA